MPRLYGRLLLAMVALVVVACQGDQAIDNERLILAYQNGDSGIWVSGAGEIREVLSNEQVGGETMQRIQVAITDNMLVMVWCELSEQGAIPFSDDSSVTFQGFYEWQPNGGLVKVGEQSGEGAPDSWIEYDGKRYL